MCMYGCEQPAAPLTGSHLGAVGFSPSARAARVCPRTVRMLVDHVAYKQIDNGTFVKNMGLSHRTTGIRVARAQRPGERQLTECGASTRRRPLSVVLITAFFPPEDEAGRLVDAWVVRSGRCTLARSRRRTTRTVVV